MTKQLDLTDIPVPARAKPRAVPDMTSAEREVAIRKMIARGAFRDEIQEAVGCSDSSLRVILWRIKRDDGQLYVAPPVRKSGTVARLQPQTEREKQKYTRDDDRLAKIDKSLKKAKVCKIHFLRKFGGRCFDCDAGARSTGMGQSMAGSENW